MKKIFYLFFSILILTTVSCKKEEVELPPQNEVQIENEISVWGVWELVSGKMYVDNLETGEKIVYNHFGGTKTLSSLRYSGTIFNIEEIEMGVTTWEFIKPVNSTGIGVGTFILNGDTEHPYGFNVTQHNWTIIEHPLATEAEYIQLGGSARPISSTIYDYSSQEVRFRIQEGYENINGYNCHYFNELIFRKIQ